MKIKILKKENIKDLLRDALSAWNVYAPLTHDGVDVLISRLPNETELLENALARVALDASDTIVSEKHIFFPQLEKMFDFENNEFAPVLESSARLLFGVKSCDLAGIVFADGFFGRNYKDAYYASRAEERLVVTIGCTRPPRPDACFCVTARTGPFAKKDFDLQLVDCGDEYIVEVGTKAGFKFIKTYAGFFENAPKGAGAKALEVKERAAASVTLRPDFDKAIRLMQDDSFLPEENYSRIAERCIYCGACLYVCPTCTCFNVFDWRRGKGSGERLRAWDGCVFSGYTQEASGANPRKEKSSRTRRRYEHKLKYDYALTGKSGCVACGRCLSSCPVNIGISKFIEEITEDKKIL